MCPPTTSVSSAAALPPAAGGSTSVTPRSRPLPACLSHVCRGLAQAARPPLGRLQAGAVHHKLASGLVVHSHSLQPAHKGAVAQLRLCIGANHLFGGGGGGGGGCMCGTHVRGAMSGCWACTNPDCWQMTNREPCQDRDAAVVSASRIYRQLLKLCAPAAGWRGASTWPAARVCPGSGWWG